MRRFITGERWGWGVDRSKGQHYVYENVRTKPIVFMLNKNIRNK